jgi:hypothetical protein
MAGLWSALGRALARLEAIAAAPEHLLAETDVVESLPSLQYVLHSAGELVVGIEPPPGAETAHAELAAALSDARDTTAAVVEALEYGGVEAAAELVHEWRGALFRVRLARLRLSIPRPVAAPPQPSAYVHAIGLTMLLVLAGVLAFTAGALLVLWPVWLAGLALVVVGFFAYRP